MSDISVVCVETGKEKKVKWDLATIKNNDLLIYLRHKFNADLTIYSIYGSVDGFHYVSVNSDADLRQFTVIRDVQRDLTYKFSPYVQKKSSMFSFCSGKNSLETSIMSMQALNNNFSIAQKIAKTFEQKLIASCRSPELFILASNASLSGVGNIILCQFTNNFSAEILEDKYICFIVNGLRYTILLETFYRELRSSLDFKNVVNYHIYINSAECISVYLSLIGDYNLSQPSTKFDKEPTEISVPETLSTEQITLELATRKELLEMINAANELIRSQKEELNSKTEEISMLQSRLNFQASEDQNRSISTDSEIVRLQAKVNELMASVSLTESSLKNKTRELDNNILLSKQLQSQLEAETGSKNVLNTELDQIKTSLSQKESEIKQHKEENSRLITALKSTVPAPIPNANSASKRRIKK